MREIIFRGKRVDDGKWVYGCYVHQDGDDYIFFTNHKTDYDFDYSLIDKETVGQYTGLTDKNGNKIFEGDIIRWTTSTYYPTVIIEFFDGVFVIKDKGNHLRAPLYHYCHLVEVIGNIHDNPELLEDN